MGLGSRTARQHETSGFRKQAVVSEDFADFKVREAVMTVDGYPGVVEAVLDGPFPVTESYVVRLANGLCGGEYQAGQLTPLGLVQGSHENLASRDYPELSEILYNRPDIATEPLGG